jgi:hypothetical protein
MVRKAEVKIQRSVNRRHLYWPARATTYPGYGWNRDYEDLRADCSWKRAKEAVEYESSLLQRHAASHDILGEYEDEECEETMDALLGLDVGVASAVIALTAGGCITHSSCNGGVLGNPCHASPAAS